MMLETARNLWKTVVLNTKGDDTEWKCQLKNEESGPILHGRFQINIKAASAKVSAATTHSFSSWRLDAPKAISLAADVQHVAKFTWDVTEDKRTAAVMVKHTTLKANDNGHLHLETRVHRGSGKLTPRIDCWHSLSSGASGWTLAVVSEDPHRVRLAVASGTASEDVILSCDAHRVMGRSTVSGHFGVTKGNGRRSSLSIAWNGGSVRVGRHLKFSNTALLRIQSGSPAASEGGIFLGKLLLRL
mmetsp:Transcript_22373/g.54662  ORF Transcript_22373/g.54662 Transcript_22373/m.54662 type:complete len:244 (+) Transcript_22373:3-734(+)